MDDHVTITVSAEDAAMANRIEAFILGWEGWSHSDDEGALMHDIEINFPTASYRAFFLAWGRLVHPNGRMERS